MQIAVTHTNTDFDALASLVAATYLYPGTIGVLPGQLRPNVKHFLALHRDLFKLGSIREVDLESVTGLIVVDTNHWGRLDRLASFQQRDDVSVELWDHHMSGGNIDAPWKCQEPAGANITLMLREIRKRDCAFSPMHATLFLMGIYEDTGNLVYSSTRAEDAQAAGFLLENGADLNVAMAYLSLALDGGHTDVLTDMLDSSETHLFGGCTVGIIQMPVASGLTQLSAVVAKYKDIKGLDGVFGVFSCTDRSMVIGCSGAPDLDVGGVMRRLGGGGHPGAGSAVVRSEDAAAVGREVVEIIADQMSRPRTRVRDIMSQPEAVVPSTASIREVRSRIENTRSRMVLVMDDGRLSGLVSREECGKAKNDSQLQAPVKAFMRTKISQIHPEDTPREALRIMTEADTGVLPVVEDDRLVGVITRADLLLHIYAF
jgi:nanoRNase/pAp phosphatase (c-di-AMP/oligoRNAs hydrolase)